MISFQQIRSFGAVSAAIAEYFRALEKNVADAVDAIKRDTRPAWNVRSTSEETTLIAPWDFLRVGVSGRVLLPAPSLPLAGTEVRIALASSSLSVTVSAVRGLVNNAATYTAAGIRVHALICSGDGWYVYA